MKAEDISQGFSKYLVKLVERPWFQFLFCFLLLTVAKKMASVHLLSMSLFRNIGYLSFWEDLGKRK